MISAQREVKLSDIVIDGGTQQREKIDLDVVAEYAEAMKCGAKFPAVLLVYDGVAFWLADGFHRYHAYREAGIDQVLAEVFKGTMRDALLFSAGANNTHGVRPTNQDKRRSVFVLLNDLEWNQWSDHQIAKHCHVTHPFVGKCRKELIHVDQKPLVTVTSADTKSLETNNNKIEESYNPDDDLLSELNTTIETLSSENDVLKDRLAVHVMSGSEEEKSLAKDTIESLRAENTVLKATLDAVTKSRDSFQLEVAELKQQIQRQRKEISKLTPKK